MLHHVPRPREYHTTAVALCRSETCRPPDHGGPRQALARSTICDTCEDTAYQDLIEVERGWPATSHALTGHGGDTLGARVSGTPTRRPGADLHAVEARTTIRYTLATWVHRLRDDGLTLTVDTGDPMACARAVRAHLTRITRHPTASSNDWPQVLCLDARVLRDLTRQLVAPSRSRVIPVHLACEAPDCAGSYRARLTDRGEFPTLVCDRDREHTLATADYMRRSHQMTAARPTRLGMGQPARHAAPAVDNAPT